MEKATNVRVIPSNFGWSDVGTWASLYDIREHDYHDNAVAGKQVMMYDSVNNMIHADDKNLVIVYGLENYIVIDSPDVLLICPKDQEQKIITNIQIKTKHDSISNVPLLVGLPSSLNVSYYDINNNQINFITPNIIIYLSSGLKTYIYSVLKSTNTITTPDEKSIFTFNGELNSTQLPDHSKNNPYVISTGPISPYVTFSYTSVTQYNTPISNGSYTLASQTNKIIISNIDATSINAVPFISLLYTIINTNTTLNILNMDYSLICSILITGVALGQTQSSFTYSIVSGNVPKKSSITYIFTLLQSSDIISSVNNTKLYNEILTKNNNLILGIQNSIQKSYINSPQDLNIQQAQTIISNAASQATILLTTSFINSNSTSLQISNSTITIAFNAINYALLGDPDDGELLYFYGIVTQLTNPIIVTTLLNNALIHIKNLIRSTDKTSENYNLYLNAQDSISSALTQIAVPSALDSPTLNTPSSVYIPTITNALKAVNTALISNPDNIDLLKAQSNLVAIEPIASGTYKIENLQDVSDVKTKSTDDSSYNMGLISGCICCLIFLGGLAYLANSYFAKGDKQLFSESSSSSSSDSSSSSSSGSSDSSE
jgi:hypothetical protein